MILLSFSDNSKCDIVNNFKFKNMIKKVLIAFFAAFLVCGNVPAASFTVTTSCGKKVKIKGKLTVKECVDAALAMDKALCN